MYVESPRNRIIELNGDERPSILELTMKLVGGRTDAERTVTVTGIDDNTYDFIIDADKDYTGWHDRGLPLTEAGDIDQARLPDHIFYMGRVAGAICELYVTKSDPEDLA